LLERRWLLEQPNTKISKVLVSKSTKASEFQWPEVLGHMQFTSENITSDSVKANDDPLFYVLRDDLLHPLLGGNKLRKLDALLPLLEDCGATDVVRNLSKTFLMEP
jgi:D-cysteine desulfhydrase